MKVYQIQIPISTSKTEGWGGRPCKKRHENKSCHQPYLRYSGACISILISSSYDEDKSFPSVPTFPYHKRREMQNLGGVLEPNLPVRRKQKTTDNLTNQRKNR